MAIKGSGDNLDRLLSFFSDVFGSDQSIMSVSPVITTVSQVIVQANPKRCGLILYNNSANSVYIGFGPLTNSSNKMSLIIPTFAQVILPLPIYRGIVSGIRNSGTGTVLVTEMIANW